MIQKNIERLNQLRFLINEHCMCADIIEEKERLIIVFPLGYMLNGICHNYNDGKINAFERCLERMEFEWKESLKCFSL